MARSLTKMRQLLIGCIVIPVQVQWPLAQTIMTIVPKTSGTKFHCSLQGLSLREILKFASDSLTTSVQKKNAREFKERKETTTKCTKYVH